MFTLEARPYTLRVGSLVTWDRNERGSCATRSARSRSPISTAYRARAAVDVHAARRRAAADGRVTQGATFIQAEFAKWRWNIGVGAALRVAERHRRSRRAWRRASACRAASAATRPTSAPAMAGSTAGCPRASKRKRFAWRRDRPKKKSSFAIRRILDPFDGGTCRTRRDPPTRLTRWPMPSCHAGSASSVGIDHQIRQGLRVNFDTFYETHGQRLPLARSERAGRWRASGSVIRPRAARAVDRPRRARRLQRRSQLLAASGHVQQHPLRLLAQHERRGRCADAAADGDVRSRVGAARAKCATGSTGTSACRSSAGACSRRSTAAQLGHALQHDDRPRRQRSMRSSTIGRRA